MAYVSPEPVIYWENPPGPRQGVILRHRLNGEEFDEYIPYNGIVTQALAARLLDVSLMTINNWVRGKKLRHIKIAGQPSVIPFAEVKRIKAIRERDAQLMARQRGR